jgi:hypothetical protein
MCSRGRDRVPTSSLDLPMITRCVRRFIVLCSLLALPACTSPGPTGPEIEDTLARQTEDAIRSAEGPWSGVAAGGSLRLEFSLTQTPDGRLQGTGTMREAQAAAAVPITVAGTYNRPNLSLTFTGMVYEGRDVVGTFAAPYTSFSGVSGTLQLTAESHARSLSLLLQEGTLAGPSLGGRLSDAVTGAAVVGATVSVQGNVVTSSSTGHYGFNPNLTPGTCPVTVTYPHSSGRRASYGRHTVAATGTTKGEPGSCCVTSEARRCVQQRARCHGIPGIHGNVGILESVTYRI